MWQERKWSLLQGLYSSLHDDLIHQWQTILDDPKTGERKCLEFIRDHSALFFNRRFQVPFAISELSLGSEHRIDFVTVSEGFSGGTSYKLIELESPNSCSYRKDGRTSQRLSVALDQIAEWRRWISSHRSLARKIFPSARWSFNAEPTFSYQIVIGRRTETKLAQGKIWSKLHDQRIEIISFDRLSDQLKFPLFPDHFWASLSSEGRSYLKDKNLLNLAISPFMKSVSDSEWRAIMAKHSEAFSEHIIPPYLDFIVNESRINKDLLARFDQLDAKPD